jgi:choline monooxygenase
MTATVERPRSFDTPMPDHLQAILAEFDPDLPLERARTIPGSWYHDRGLAAAERHSVFGATWQLSARLDQLSDRGAYCTLELAGEPVLLVRGEDDTLRAFANVCRHRAARVMEEPSGCATRLRCRYHGWTYDLAGRLRGTPEFDGVEEFDREQSGLVPLPLATWGPFVWVYSGASSALSLAEYLSPLSKRIGNLGLESLRFVERREYRVACNWKVYVDNYLDGGYHVNTVHPGLASVLDYAHYRTEVEAAVSVQISPLSGGNSALSNVRTGDAAYYAWVFPNVMFNVYEGVMDVNQVFPEDENHCRVNFDFYFGESATTQQVEESIAAADRIQVEDVEICEEVQSGLASRHYCAGRYSVRREASVYQFHRLLAQYLRAGA